MKLRLMLLLALGLLLLPMHSSLAAQTKAESTVDIAITPATYIYQISKMETDPQPFIGKTVSIEGFFRSFTYGEPDQPFTYHMVYRYTPGNCCVDMLGLEVYWANEEAAYPPKDAWVSAKGTVEQYTLDGYTYLHLRLTELETLAQQGAALVE